MFRYLLFMLFILFNLSSSIYADDNPAVITNDELVKYKKKSDNSLPQMEYEYQEPYVRKDETQKQAAYESWCNAGTKYRNNVYRIKEEVEAAEEKLKKTPPEFRRLSCGKLVKSSRYQAAENNLTTAKRRLANAELDLSELESQAHRSGIKQGWIRCQK
jgi:predicted  nucleic acid-binding Zn-ribbon protein